MTDPAMNHFAEAEGYLRDLDSLDPPEAYVAVIAAQAHATLAQGQAASEMVGLQKSLLMSMLPQSDGGATAPPAVPTATPAATGGGLAAERATPTAAPSSAPGRPLSSFIHDTLVAHQRKDASSCLCGWSVWGASHALHVAKLLLEGIDNSLFTEGFDVACGEIVKDLTRLHDEAITGERKDAYEKAIAAAEHQREWK